MAVWWCVPSARPNGGTFPLWREMGYKVALFRDPGAPLVSSDLTISEPYPGYSVATNRLIAEVLKMDPECMWVVGGGDDVEPDLAHRADEIAGQCSKYFGIKENREQGSVAYLFEPKTSTFGVMQPTGDRFADGSIDRICGSPWIGREFAQRINGGHGPFWTDYAHMFADEEIQEVAQRLGVLWQRRDLIHLHHHFMRKSTDLNSPAVPKAIPEHLVEANSPEHWNRYQGLFLSRKRAGFPGHEPLPA